MSSIKSRIRSCIRKVLTGPNARRICSTHGARDTFFLMASNFTPAILTEQRGLRYLVATADRTVGREVFHTGGYDWGQITGILDLLRKLGFSFQGRTIIDIGANIGTSSIPMVAEGTFARAIAIEPEPFNFRLLTANVALNGLSDRFTCVNAAVTDALADLEFELSPLNYGDHRVRLAAGTGHEGEQDRPVIRVPGITFDSLVSSGTVDLDRAGLVWIDTQGHEGQVLRGANTLLTSQVPVVLEYWPYALRRANGMAMLEEAISDHYESVADLREAVGTGKLDMRPASGISSFRDIAMTDLLLLPKACTSKPSDRMFNHAK
jgi:FkbM family methyltransferase